MVSNLTAVNVPMPMNELVELLRHIAPDIRKALTASQVTSGPVMVTVTTTRNVLLGLSVTPIRDVPFVVFHPVPCPPTFEHEFPSPVDQEDSAWITSNQGVQASPSIQGFYVSSAMPIVELQIYMTEKYWQRQLGPGKTSSPEVSCGGSTPAPVGVVPPSTAPSTKEVTD